MLQFASVLCLMKTFPPACCSVLLQICHKKITQHIGLNQISECEVKSMACTSCPSSQSSFYGHWVTDIFVTGPTTFTLVGLHCKDQSLHTGGPETHSIPSLITHSLTGLLYQFPLYTVLPQTPWHWQYYQAFLLPLCSDMIIVRRGFLQPHNLKLLPRVLHPTPLLYLKSPDSASLPGNLQVALSHPCETIGSFRGRILSDLI